MIPVVSPPVGAEPDWDDMAAYLTMSEKVLHYSPFRPQSGCCRHLWLITLGILDKEFARKTAGNMPEHTAIPLKLFTAETPLGTYQGMTDQIEFSSLPQRFTSTVLQPMSANLAEWLPSGTFAASPTRLWAGTAKAGSSFGDGSRGRARRAGRGLTPRFVT